MSRIRWRRARAVGQDGIGGIRRSDLPTGQDDRSRQPDTAPVTRHPEAATQHRSTDTALRRHSIARHHRSTTSATDDNRKRSTPWPSHRSELGIGIRRHFTTAGVHPYDEVVWERRDARITNYRDGAVAFEQLDVEVPAALEPQRHQHPRPEVLPGDPRHRRARVVAAPGGRPGGRHRHRLGDQGRLLRRRRGGRDLPGRAQAPDHPPDGGLQLAGVVQHRGGRRAPAGLGLLHPRRSTTPWTRSSTGTPRRA